MYFGHYAVSYQLLQKSILSKREFEMIDTQNSSTSYVVMYKLIR